MTAVLESRTLDHRAGTPWWLCPSTRELSLRSKIKMGYSTVGSRISKNRHNPVLGTNIHQITSQEVSIIAAVLARAEAMEKINQMRISSLMMEYEQLKESCRGNGIDTCVLCGYNSLTSEKNLQTKKCDKCEKLTCSTCYQSKLLHSGTRLIMCKLCYDYQELWCKTGAWMMDRLPRQSASEDEIEEWRIQREISTAPRPSIGLLGGQEIHLDQEYFTQDEDDESEEDVLEKSNTISSYSNIKFLDDNDTSHFRSPSPAPGLAVLSDMTERGSLSLPGHPRRKSLNTEPRRLTAVTAENRDQLAVIRDKIVKQRAIEGASPSHSPHPNIQGTKSFDSTDSEFEPVRVHQSLEIEDEKEMQVSLPESPKLKNLSEAEENGESTREETSSLSESREMSEDSDFEFDDVELPPRAMSFLRFGVTRAPIRAERRSSEEKPERSTSESENCEVNKKEHESKEGNEEEKEIKNEREEVEIEHTATSLKDADELGNLSDEETPVIEGTAQMLGVDEGQMKRNEETSLETEETLKETETETEEKQMWGGMTENKKEEELVVEKEEEQTHHGEGIGPDSKTEDKPEILLTETTTASIDDQETDRLDKELSPPSTSSSTASSPRKTRRLTVLTSSGEDSTHKDSEGFRWKRRNATRSPVGDRKNYRASSNPGDNEGGSSSMSKDQSLLSKREKARLAAKRIREGRKLLSNSRRNEEEEDKDILEFVSSPPPPSKVSESSQPDHGEEQSVREKARLAARRVREGRRVLSNSRRREEEENDDILEFVPSATNVTVDYQTGDEQLI